MKELTATIRLFLLFVMIEDALSKASKCFVGTSRVDTQRDFFEHNCTMSQSTGYCWTAAFTDPDLLKAKGGKYGKWCDDDTDATKHKCTKNGLTKLEKMNVYCCDTDLCNDFVCDDTGYCGKTLPTTTLETTSKSARQCFFSDTMIVVSFLSAWFIATE